MEVHTNIPLKNFTTMKIGGNARFLVEARTLDEVASAATNAKKQQINTYILGGGSNLIATDDGFNGLIIRMRIPGFDIIADDPDTTTIKVGAGENWDETVKKTVDMHLSGIETLSGIPGTVGASPVQNIGAYGQEVSDTIVSVQAYDTEEGKHVSLANSACSFSYRDSIFKSKFFGRFIITSVTFKLYKTNPKPPFYDSLQKYFDEHSIQLFTVEIIRDSVLKIRADKLPDPSQKPNSGSFFKNVIVEDWQLDGLKRNAPDMPTFDMGEHKYKIPAGWLIDQSGLKGQLLHGIRVYEKNALVLVNESATSYQDLAQAKTDIIDAVRNKFSLVLEQEPLIIPS